MTQGFFNKNSSEKDYSMLAYILNGRNRIKIFLQLLEEPSFAYEIAKKEGLFVSAVTRSLKDLSGAGIVKCLNPNDKYKKIYQLTKEATQLKKEVEKKSKFIFSKRIG